MSTRPRRVRSENGFTLIELLIVVAIIAILATLAGMFLLRARAAANESSAISSLRSMVSAQANYHTTCGRGGYSTSVANLVTRGYLNPDLLLSPKSGFSTALGPGTGVQGPVGCDGAATRTTFYFSATPLSSTSGRRAFATNQLGTIWQDVTGVAPVEPFAIGPSVQPIQ